VTNTEILNLSFTRDFDRVLLHVLGVPSEQKLINFAEDHSMNIPMKCDFKVPSGFEEEDQNVKSLQYPTILFPTECKLCVCLTLVYWGCSIISNFRNKVPIVKKNPLTVHFSIEKHIGIRNFANTLQLLQINRNY
jgi:hypothetical protein